MGRHGGGSRSGGSHRSSSSGRSSGRLHSCYTSNKAFGFGMTDNEEQEVLALLQDVYDASGMPVTVYTDDFSWKEHYDSLEVHSISF